jgi:hypothetical protein
MFNCFRPKCPVDPDVKTWLGEFQKAQADRDAAGRLGGDTGS